MDDSKRARNGKLRIQPRDGAYVDSPDLQNALQRIRQAACRENSLRTSVVIMPSTTPRSFPEMQLRVIT